MNVHSEFHSGSGTTSATPKAICHARPVVRYVEVKADATNTSDIFVGPSTLASPSSGYRLAAGEKVQIPIDNAGKVYVGGASQGYSYLVV